jgi:type IV pilus assembly protein PilB
MARADQNRERIGDMLVAAGLITSSQLDEALDAQRETRLPIGKQLVAMNYVSEVQLTQLLSHQLSVPWVSLDRVEFSEELLARVPADLAERFSVMPIYVRSVRHQGATLYIAMDDPTQEEALRRVSIASGLPVKPMIASPTDIRRAIDVHYFGGTAEESEPEIDEEVQVDLKSEAPGESQGELPGDASRRLRPPPVPPRKRSQRPIEATVPVEQYETPSSPPAQQPRTLTLLDGTTISLPKNPAKRLVQDATEVRHVVKAVRAANADLGIEGAPRWHDVVQVLLDVLHARGFRITRKEVHEAWLRARQVEPEAKPTPAEDSEPEE